MPNLTRCANGHFYDSDKYRSCPYCDQASVVKTEPIPQPKPIIPDKKPDDIVVTDEGHTVGLWDVEYTNTVVKPVVGWLVSIEGTTCGKDFRLCAGRNYIGRSADMDIILEQDTAVSRSKHAIIIFDPISKKTLCQAGESRELFYLNGKVVTDSIEIQKGDVLTVGKTKLMFVPFCGELHTWDTPAE